MPMNYNSYSPDDAVEGATESGQDDLFDIEQAQGAPLAPPEPQPLYQIYEGSKIIISKQVGKYWKNKYDAALTAYEEIRDVWEEIYRYYNHHQTKTMQTPRGVFRRGDSSENVLFSNLNIMLPAIYSRDPDMTCITNDKQDEPFTMCLEALLNALFQRKNLLSAKPKIKKAAGVALLTNFGVLKLDWTKKDASVENAAVEMQRISTELIQAKDQEKVEELYGQLQSLEQSMEILKPGGPGLSNVLPHNLIIDPYAEQPDGADAAWMCETVFYPTAGLSARFTFKEDAEETKNPVRKLIYKPTHKAVFAEGAGGSRDDGLGMVLTALNPDGGAGNVPVSFEEEGRRAYINQYFTECKLLWDKQLRRVMLFHVDDWTWPLWVWDDPLGITRFFPYFVVSLTMNTGGSVGIGETAYVLDQQDEINDMNRQMAKIRRSVFDFYYYNSSVITQDDAEKFVNGLRGNTQGGKHLMGVNVGEDGKIQDTIQSFAPPALEYEMLFDKPKILDAINRITNTSDALRGVQFKTNTNVASVQSYQESMKLSVGAKVDVLEDTVADIGLALAELAVQNYTREEVASLVGDQMAQAWEQMSVQAFTKKYSVNVVAGSMEKPNSVFRKKEALEVAQTVGQFAKGAPGASMMIMLRVLEQAFTEVNIKPEDWEMIKQEIAATLTRGQTGQGGPPGAGPEAPPQGAQNGQAIMDAAKRLPPEDQQKIMAMHQQGASPQDIMGLIQQRTGAQLNG